MSERDEAIARRAKQVPDLYRPNYLKATRGEASKRDAIKAFCLECVGWARGEVTLCTALACPLWAYRPYQKESNPPASVDFGSQNQTDGAK